MRKGINPFFAFLLFLLIFFLSSCAKEEKKTFVSRKAKKSISLLSGERGFAVDTFLLLDQSGSMSGYPSHPATDPKGLRVDAAKYLIRNIAQKSAKKLPHRIAVVNFGSEAKAGLTTSLKEVTNLEDDIGVRELISSLEILSVGDTSFIKALKRAYQGFLAKDTFQKSRKPAIIIFTDGKPDDRRKLKQSEYFEEIEEFISSSLSPKGCSIYIIGVDAYGASWTESMPLWKKILSPDNVYSISSMGDLRKQFNQTIRKLFGIPPVSPDTVTKKGLKFEVPPYLKKIEFHIFPQREGLTLSVFSPDGKAISSKDEDVLFKEYETYDIITVLNPAFGEWRYQIIKGKGKIEVYRNAIPIKMKLISPREVHPLGKPMKLTASFLTPEGKEVEEVPQYPIGLSAKVITPQGKEFDLKLKRKEKGIYSGLPKISEIKSEGVWKVILTIKGGDVYRSSSENLIQVKSMPYIAIDKPKEGSTLPFGKSLLVEASLLRNGRAVSPKKEFVDHPGLIVLAQIVKMPNGEKSESIWLQPKEDTKTSGKFRGYIEASFQEEGEYVLMTKLAGNLASGGSLPEDYTKISFSLRPTFWQGNWHWLLGLIVIAALGSSIYYLSLPKLQGILYVQKKGETAREYNLLNFGHKASIGGRKSDILLTEEAEGKCGYIVAKRKKGRRGEKKVISQIHYPSSLGSKNLRQKDLKHGDIVQIEEITLEYQR